MNFKKFISGVSALTIAASAFAGMAVTASAAAVTDSIYGQIIGIDFGDTNSSNPYANTVNLSSASIANYTYNTGDGDFSDSDTSRITTADTTLGGSNNKYSYPGANHYIVTNGTDASVTIPSGLRVDNTKDKVELTFGMAWGNINGQRTGFKIYAGSTAIADFSTANWGGVDSSRNTFDFPSTVAKGHTNNGADWAKKTTFKITVDYSTLTMTAIVDGDTANPYTAALNSGTEAVSKLAFDTGVAANQTARRSIIDDISITNIEGEAQTFYPYTVNYYCGDNLVATDNGERVAGGSVTARTEPFEITTSGINTRYYYKEGETTSFTVTADGTNTWNVNVREADIYTVSAKGIYGNNYSVLKADTEVVEGNTFEYTFPKYLTDNNNKVVGISSTDWYGATVTPTEDFVYEVSYTPYSGKNMYFVEGEKAITSSNATLTGYALSGGVARRGIQEQKKTLITVPESGIYNVTFAAATSNYGAGKGGDVTLYNGENVIRTLNVDYITVSNVRTDGTVVTPNVTLKKGDVISVLTTMSTGSLDYVLLEKTDDITVGEFVDQPWNADSNTSGYTVDGNTLTDENGNVVYAYSSTFTAADGATYKMIVTNGTESFERPVTNTVFASESQVMFFLITNQDIDKAGSYVTYAE